MPNRFSPIPPRTSPEQQNAIINRNFAELDNENVKKIMYGADGVPRISLDSTTGQIKVAPAGVDVTTATDDQLNFNSSQRVMKIALKDQVTVTKEAGDTVGVAPYNHNLGFIPSVQAYIDFSPTTQSPVPYIDINSISGLVDLKVEISYINDTEVVFAIIAPETSSDYAVVSSYTIVFYLLQEPAN